MKTVILCGGQGTRIRDVSQNIPKPMIPIGPYPIVKHIMDIYSKYGCNEFILCLGYLGWKIKEYFLNYRSMTETLEIDFRKNGSIRYLEQHEDILPWNIVFAETGLNSMTGSRVKRIQKFISNETFMLTYGDGVGDINIEELITFHKSHGKLATMTTVRPPSRFGELTIADNCVTSFREKPQVPDGYINGGFFVCEPKIFDFINADENCIFEKEPLQALAEMGELMSYHHSGFWMPMDTSREYSLLNEMWNNEKAVWSPKRG